MPPLRSPGGRASSAVLDDDEFGEPWNGSPESAYYNAGKSYVDADNSIDDAGNDFDGADDDLDDEGVDRDRLDGNGADGDRFDDDDDDLADARSEPRRHGGLHRLPPPPSALRGRVAVAAVALGAIAAASSGGSLLPHTSTQNLSLGNTRQAAAIIGASPDSQQSLDVQSAARVIDPAAQAQQLAETAEITGQQLSSAGQSDQSVPGTGGSFAKPTTGAVVSTFGGRYGTFHYGIEISNKKDTPIVAAADGTIIAAGPTSGFGLWVKERLSDGTVLVYARMDDFSVHVGQQVTAGQQIARMGDRGFGSGYTLHFEVWQPDGHKIDPEQWLNTRGITV